MVLEETGIAAKGVMMVERRIRVVRLCREEGMRIAVDGCLVLDGCSQSMNPRLSCFHSAVFSFLINAQRLQVQDKQCSCISAPRYAENRCIVIFDLIAEQVRNSSCACPNRSCVFQNSNQSHESTYPLRLCISGTFVCRCARGLISYRKSTLGHNPMDMWDDGIICLGGQHGDDV